MKRIKVVEFNRWHEGITNKNNLLDIGCWDGKFIEDLKDRTGCDVWGVDIDKSELALASNKIRDRLAHADACKEIPFKQKFDYVLLSEVIEHVDNQVGLIRNISNSLKKGGELILTTPRSVPFFQIWDPAWVRWKFGGPIHNHFTIKELDQKLSQYGLKITYYAIGGSFLWMITRWLSVILRFGLRIKVPLCYFSEQEGFCDIKLVARKIK